MVNRSPVSTSSTLIPLKYIVVSEGAAERNGKQVSAGNNSKASDHRRRIRLIRRIQLITTMSMLSHILQRLNTPEKRPSIAVVGS
jgi:hypothetical protein